MSPIFVTYFTFSRYTLRYYSRGKVAQPIFWLSAARNNASFSLLYILRNKYIQSCTRQWLAPASREESFI